MTGIGEGIIRLVIAKSICDHLAMEKSPAVAARQVLRMLVSRIRGSAGALVLSPDGRFAITTFAPLQRPVRDYATQKNVLDSLRKALLRQLTVVLRGYQKPGAGHSKDYLVDPYSLVLYQYGLYLVGYSHRAREIRTFAVERIKSVEVTEDMFELPQSFSLAERFDQGFGLIEEPPQEVKIWISRDWAYFVKERSWHPTQILHPQKDGSVILTMRCGGLDELTAWVLSFGPGARVLAPQALIDNVSSQLTLAAKPYQSSR